MEQAFLAWLAQQLPQHAAAPWGIADDTALVRLARAETLVTADLISDEVDFRLAEVDPRRIGRKALAVNLSDMASMAARPVAAIISLLLPSEAALSRTFGGQPPYDTLELAKRLYEGLLPLAKAHDVAIAGGDVNVWDHPLAINVTVLGEAGPAGPVRRIGARPGDWIIVTGRLGGSILGHHFDFEPRVKEALALASAYELHAGMDISDGLALDLSRLAAASGCGAVLELDVVPIAAAAHTLAASQPGQGTALDHALGDGEDFELLLAVPEKDARRMIDQQPLADVPVTCIGRFIEEAGLWAQDSTGQRMPLPPRGFLHG